MSDFYQTLGVSRQADEAEIRRAYRQLAKQHHPDLNGGDAAADARFKAINEAYEVLRDPQKRALYDRYGAAAFQGGGRGAAESPFGGAGDLGDLFEQLFNFGGARRGGRTQQGGAERGESLQVKLRLDFREAVFGVTKTVQVQRQEGCATCQGTGAAPGTRPATCRACQGQGELRQVQQSVFGQFVNVQACPACRGRGQVVEKPCEDCRGQGRQAKPRSLEVDVPAGVEDGTQIRLTGEGGHGRLGGPPGDLFVVLQVREDPVFLRQGTDLHLALRLNPADAALGADLEIPTLEGQTRLVVPAGTQTGDQFSLEGQGVPFLRRAGRGRLVVTAFVMTPERLGARERQLFEQLREGLPPSGVEEREGGAAAGSGIWQKIKEFFS